MPSTSAAVIETLEKAPNWNSPFARVVRWIAVFVIGLGILWVVEVFLNYLIDLGLDWRVEGLGYYLLFFGSGVLVLVAIIIAAKFAARCTTFLAPLPRTGLALLGTVYVVAQAVRLYSLFGEGESVWQFALMKFEFAVVVSVVFTLAYRPDDLDREEEAGASR